MSGPITAHVIYRDKKALQAQVEKLTKDLEGRDGEHDATVAKLVSKHEVEAAAAAQELEVMQQGRVSSRPLLKTTCLSFTTMDRHKCNT